MKRNRKEKPKPQRSDKFPPTDVTKVKAGALLDVFSVFVDLSYSVELSFDPESLSVSFYDGKLGVVGRVPYSASPKASIVGLTISIPTLMLKALVRYNPERSSSIVIAVADAVGPLLQPVLTLTTADNVVFEWLYKGVPADDTSTTRLHTELSSERELQTRELLAINVKSMASALRHVVNFPKRSNLLKLSVYIGRGVAAISSNHAGRAVKSESLNEFLATISEAECKSLASVLAKAPGEFTFKQSKSALYFVSENWLVRCAARDNIALQDPFEGKSSSSFSVQTTAYQAALNRAIGQFPNGSYGSRNKTLTLDLRAGDITGSFRVVIPKIDVALGNEAIIDFPTKPGSGEAGEHSDLKLSCDCEWLKYIGVFSDQTIEVCRLASDVRFAERSGDIEILTVVPMSRLNAELTFIAAPLSRPE